MKAIFYTAVFGLVASALAHFSTFLGINPLRAFPPVWGLHVLIFVVWIPALVASRSICKKANPWGFWRTAMRNVPNWMKVLTVALVAYAFFNFFFTTSVLSEDGVPSVLDGKKVIHNHGKVIRELTDEEYELHQAYEVRAFSGHWMMFYAVGMVLLSAKLREDSNEALHGDAVDRARER